MYRPIGRDGSHFDIAHNPQGMASYTPNPRAMGNLVGVNPRMAAIGMPRLGMPVPPMGMAPGPAMPPMPVGLPPTAAPMPGAVPPPIATPYVPRPMMGV